MTHLTTEDTNRLYINNITITLYENIVKAQNFMLNKADSHSQIVAHYTLMQYWHQTRKSKMIAEAVQSLELEERQRYTQAMLNHSGAYQAFYEHFKEIISSEESVLATTAL